MMCGRWEEAYMASTFGYKIKVSLFGQSHGEKLGVVLDGLPAGEKVDSEALKTFLRRRAPGGSLVSARRETDEPQIVSGLYEGKTCGAPLCILFDNADAQSSDYEALRYIPRPSHADYPAYVKYSGCNDMRGGGHFSARLTAPLCAAGGIVIQLLARRGIHIGAHLLQAGSIRDIAFDPLYVSAADFPSADGFPACSQEAEQAMKTLITETKEAGDSVGGIVECAVLHLPVGLGEPMFDGIENRMAQAVFAIPAVRGIEFGDGFASSVLRGSAHNDEYTVQDGRVRITFNHAGGVLGGLATGAPLLFRVAFKPTPSIALPQHSVNLKTGEDTMLSVKGRHDPCVAVRAVPCVEAAAALALMDWLL